MPIRNLALGVRVLVLSVQLLAGIISGSGFVFCVAADGHTAVEVAHTDGRCLTDYRRHHPEATEACDLDQHGCVDILLSQQPLCSASARDTAAIGHNAAALAVVAAPPHSAAPWGLHRSVVSLSASDSRLAAHRTIVLIV